MGQSHPGLCWPLLFAARRARCCSGRDGAGCAGCLRSSGLRTALAPQRTERAHEGAQSRTDEMAETILVMAEQREGKLNRVSFETLAGAQALAKQTGWTVEAAVVGGGDLHPWPPRSQRRRWQRSMPSKTRRWSSYTPDGFVTALKKFIEGNKPKLVLLPHTYQVRDFAPKLAAALGAVLVSDAVGCKFEGGKLLFTRQMFQGKFAADVSLAGDGPVVCQLPDRRLSRRPGGGWRSSGGAGQRRHGRDPHPARGSVPGGQAGGGPFAGRDHRLRGTRHQGAEEH